MSKEREIANYLEGDNYFACINLLKCKMQKGATGSEGRVGEIPPPSLSHTHRAERKSAGGVAAGAR